jgi:asparagine synthase (glutamine-hydrolysing)
MGALVGVLGSVSAGEAGAMLARLRHRGRRTRAENPGPDLFLGSVGDAPETRIHARGERVLVCDAGATTGRELRRRGGVGCEGPAPGSVADLLMATCEAPGLAGLEQVDGSFALALVDRSRRRILLARDFFGTLPLYYAVVPGVGVAFASEYKALLCLRGFDASVDVDMVQYLQNAKKLPPGRTLLTHVRSVPPGCVLELAADGAQREVHRFAPLEVKVDVASEPEAAERIATGLRESVARQCGDGERIGVALSGGIDSIAVACLVRELYPDRPLHTFTASNGPDDPEGVTAGRVAAALGATHHDVPTPPDLLETRLDALVWHLEDPYARSETLQLFEVGSAAAPHVDVLISGQGADSLFGGMPRYRLLDLMRPLVGVPFLRGPLCEFYNRTQLGLRPSSWLGRALDLAYYRGKLPPVPVVRGARAQPDPVALPEPGPELVNRAMARGFQVGQSQDFPKYERCFAAHGIAYRSPFCDVAFARTAYTISDSLKIRNGVQKYILRRAMAPVVPEEFLAVPKFMQAFTHDAAFARSLDRVCSRVLSREAVARRGLFDYREIERLLRRPAAGTYSRDAASRLWTVLTTEVWARLFVDQRGAAPAAS